ncbi:MAG: UPF0262 family protein [Rhodobacteraceae bacterium]|nr:UPF0262 family protein [Paracoccaceae bacterium]
MSTDCARMSEFNRLAAVNIDEHNMPLASREVRQERDVAIYDLLLDSRFSLPDRDGRSAPPGPYCLWIGLQDNRLAFRVSTEENGDLIEFHLSMNPFRSVIKNYLRILESYNTAVKTLPRHQIEVFDQARKEIHNEGADLLEKKLDQKIIIDQMTARRLFTLVFALSRTTRLP